MYHYRKDWLTHGRFQREMLHLFRNRQLRGGIGHKRSQAVKLLVAFKAQAHSLARFSILPVDTCVHRCARGFLGQKTNPGDDP